MLSHIHTPRENHSPRSPRALTSVCAPPLLTSHMTMATAKSGEDMETYMRSKDTLPHDPGFFGMPCLRSDIACETKHVSLPPTAFPPKRTSNLAVVDASGAPTVTNSSESMTGRLLRTCDAPTRTQNRLRDWPPSGASHCVCYLV